MSSGLRSQLRGRCVEAWYRDGHTAVITANTHRNALHHALQTDGLIAVFPHPTQHPEPSHKTPWTNEQEEV